MYQKVTKSNTRSGKCKMLQFQCSFYSLPYDKILAWSKLEAFAEDKTDVVKMMISLLDRVENSVGKGENAGYQHFLLFPYCFPKASF